MPKHFSQRSRWPLYAIILIFFIPMVGAWMVYYFQLSPTRTTNRGTLVTQPESLKTLPFSEKPDAITPAEMAGKWWFLQLVPGECDDDCHTAFYYMQQVQIALGKHSERLNIGFLHPEVDTENARAIRQQYSQLHAAEVDAESIHQFLHDTIGEGANSHVIFLVDPLGNLVLYYTPDVYGKPMIKDLERLFSLSRVG